MRKYRFTKRFEKQYQKLGKISLKEQHVTFIRIEQGNDD